MQIKYKNSRLICTSLWHYWQLPHRSSYILSTVASKTIEIQYLFSGSITTYFDKWYIVLYIYILSYLRLFECISMSIIFFYYIRFSNGSQVCMSVPLSFSTILFSLTVYWKKTEFWVKLAFIYDISLYHKYLGVSCVQ